MLILVDLRRPYQLTNEETAVRELDVALRARLRGTFGLLQRPTE
jgi:hypothetical protein